MPVHFHINHHKILPYEPTIFPCRSPVDVEKLLLKHKPNNVHSSLIVILQGWQSGESLGILAAQCSIDPEFLRRHLHFLETRSFYDLPSLPSRTLNSSSSILRLRFTTICNRQLGLRPDEVIKARRSDLDGVRIYLNELRLSQQTGGSIVRRWAILDETTSLIQQDASIFVHQRRNGGWIGQFYAS